MASWCSKKIEIKLSQRELSRSEKRSEAKKRIILSEKKF